MTKTNFGAREIVAIEDFVEDSYKYINRHYFRFNNNISNKKTPSMWIENYDNEHDYVIIHFWDAKIILELSTKEDEKHKPKSIEVEEFDDDQKYYLIHFTYGEKLKSKKLKACDSIERALEYIFEVFVTYANKLGISFEDNLFVGQFKSAELNEIETLKSRVENTIKVRKIDKNFYYGFKIIDDEYLRFDFLTGYIEMRLDRAKSADMRLFGVEYFIDDCPIRRELMENGNVFVETDYFYTSMSEAIEKILSLLDRHIKFYLFEFS